MKWFHAAASQSSLRPPPGKSGRKEARWPPHTACITSTLRFPSSTHHHHPPTQPPPQRAELGNEGWKKEEEKKKQLSWAVQQVGRRLHEELDAKSSSAAPGRRHPGGWRERGSEFTHSRSPPARLQSPAPIYRSSPINSCRE